MTSKTKKILIKTVPYGLVGLLATNIGEAMRLSVGENASEKMLSFFTDGLGAAFTNIAPSFHPFDLFIGAAVGGILWLVVYLKGKNAKKYRHGEEYGSARWGDAKDIEPYIDPDFQNNVILTQTERLTKNILVPVILCLVNYPMEKLLPRVVQMKEICMEAFRHVILC